MKPITKALLNGALPADRAPFTEVRLAAEEAKRILKQGIRIQSLVDAELLPPLIERMTQIQEWHLAEHDPKLVLDMKYATEDNFLGRVLYPDDRAFLLAEVADALSAARRRLEKLDLGLKVYDAFRPTWVQQEMWKAFPNPEFVADPDGDSSNHCKGTAVDCWVVDRWGRELAKPTGFDQFGKEARRDYMDLPIDVLKHRAIVEDALRCEGFQPLASEFWHYDFPLPDSVVIRSYSPYGATEQDAA